jgi:hypothetical protein
VEFDNIMALSRNNTYREPRHMHGVPAVIYVLENSSLRSGFCKIGITRRTGWAKAMELNRDINNIIPGTFECVFEIRARDSGAALEEVYSELQYCRRGKKDQNFFEAERDRVEQALLRAISTTDQKIKIKQYQALALRRYLEEEAQQQEALQEDSQEPEAAPSGLFRKWVAAVTN